MRDADKNRDPQRAQKRALADARCAWRKMGTSQRAEFVKFMVEGLGYTEGLMQERYYAICFILALYDGVEEAGPNFYDWRKQR